MKDLFDNMHNVVEICSSIIIALLGLAYPIILDKISSIGEKYNSKYLLVLFKKEFFQKKLFLKSNIFQLALYLSLFSLVFQIFQFEPLCDWNHWFINNSADIFTFSSTLFLVVVFFIWLKDVVSYIGNIESLLKYLIAKYRKNNDKIYIRDIESLRKYLIAKCCKHNDEISEYAFMAIAELSSYAVNKKDIDLQSKLLDFYVNYVVLHRNKISNKSIKYDMIFYELVTNLVDECVENNYKHLLPLRESAISGSLLIPNDFQKKTISEETYNRLWYNFTLIRNNVSFIRRFWANSHQYYRFELEQIYPDYSNDNKEAIEQREKEQRRFLEFHYAIGGLLLYSENYEALNYITTYSQSSPPKYELLPYTMNDIFEWFEWFRNVNNHLGKFIGSIKYRFPNLDNLGNSDEVVFWICKYICILFLRQYKIPQTLYYQNSINQPALPNTVYSLREWKESLRYFKFCLNKVLEDKKLLDKLYLQKTFTEKYKEIDRFLVDLEKNIKDEIKRQKLSTELSTDKVNKFYTSSSEILSEGFEQYSEIINSNLEDKEDDMKLWLSGSLTLSDKSAFVDGDIPCINCDSSFAQSIVLNNIQRYIPNSFTIARTHRYLLNNNNLIKGIDKIIGNKINEVCIIAFNLYYKTKQVLEATKYSQNTIYLPTTDLKDCIFILNKKDLPKIEDKDLLEEEKQLLQPETINKEWNIYGKIIDINKPEYQEIKKKYVEDNLKDDDDLKVLLALLFRKQIIFKSDRKIIQIKLNSEFEELGTENSLSDLITL